MLARSLYRSAVAEHLVPFQRYYTFTLYATVQERRQVKICGVHRHGNVERGASPNRTDRPVKTRRICISFSSDLQQKWGGHFHAVATPLPLSVTSVSPAFPYDS